MTNPQDFEEQYNHANQESRLERAADFFKEIVKVVLISLAIILPVRYFLIQPFYVKGESMEPNFFDHEYLIINEITYRFNNPQRGDIVVFRYPKDPKKFFIKRVIGLPGERVKIDDGKVYISQDKESFKPLTENYLSASVRTEQSLRGYSDIVLGTDEYFVLGDNRDQSLDSRIFGPVKKDFIIGRTWIRGWPFNRLTVFNPPQYNNF